MRRAPLISSPSVSAIGSKISKPLLFLYNFLFILAVEHVFGFGSNVVISSIPLSLLCLLHGVKLEILPDSVVGNFQTFVIYEGSLANSIIFKPGILCLMIDRLLSLEFCSELEIKQTKYLFLFMHFSCRQNVQKTNVQPAPFSLK